MENEKLNRLIVFTWQKIPVKFSSPLHSVILQKLFTPMLVLIIN
jgi:hypothetical protein